MDPLKKLVADRLKMPVAGPHPDAEVLSAFAENALPENERETVLQHLSACSDCRDIAFLAAPLVADSQPVVTAAKARPFFALRWGTLAACVVIAAVFLVSRREAPRTQLAKSAPATPAAPASTATDTMVAAEKTPFELRVLREKLPAKAAVPSATNGHAEPKHITAKPEGDMSFADSGEVSVNAPATLNARVEPRTAQSVPVMGRNMADLKQISPGAMAPAPAPATAAGTGSGSAGAAVAGLSVGGPTTSNAYSYNGNLTDLTAKKDTAFHGSVFGTVFDASGAVIPNAKVTALGPLGSRTVTADEAGKYSLDQLAAGNYQLQFNAPGFREAQLQQVAVLANKPANVDVKLAPGATTETVEVAGAAPSIVQQWQQIAVPTDEQQQSADELQSRARAVEAAPAKVQKAAKTKDRVSAGVPAIAMPSVVPVRQWSLSSQGVVQRSMDNGKTWQPVLVAAGTTFRAIASLLNHVWAAGNAGVLYHSTDSGQHWAQVVPQSGSQKLQGDITQVQLLDPQHVVVITSNSETWISPDGGQSWSRK